MQIKNWVNIGKAVLLANVSDKKTPINVKYRITNKCNSHCAYCLYDKEDRDLDTDDVLSVIRQMIKAGTQRIGFAGGEALLRKDFGQVVNLCAQHGLYTTLISNGYLVPRNVEILKKINCLILSFDGPQKIHDANRESGSHKKLIHAIRVAVKHVPLITHTTLTVNNVEYIDYILDTAAKYGFYTSFCPVTFRSKMAVPDQQLKAVILKLIRMKSKGYPILISDTLLRYWLDWKDFRVPYKFTKEKGDPVCWAGKLFCEVDCDGRIAACDRTIYTSKLNIVSEGFEKAFQKLKTGNCKACMKTWDAEYNFMYSLNPGVIWNWMKFVRKT